jgi:hypothetical protein
LILFYSILNITLIFNNHDDFANQRAVSYLRWDKDQTLLDNLLDDLELHKEELGPLAYGRYYGRLTYFTSYKIQNLVVNVLERLPAISVYQSLFLNGFVLAFISLTIFWFTLVNFEKDLFYVVWTALFTGFLLKYFSLTIFLDRFIPIREPFNNLIHWLGITSANATIMIFAANLIILRSLISNKKKLIYTISLFVVTYLFHSSQSILLYGAGIICYFLGGAVYKFIIAKHKKIGLLLIYNLLIVITHILYYYIIHSFQIDLKIQFNYDVVYWWVWSNLLILYASKNNSERKNRILFIFFFFFSAITMGTNFQVYFNNELLWANLQSFFITQASFRLIWPSSLLFWLLLGETLFYNKVFLPKTWRKISIIFGIASVITISIVALHKYPDRMPLRDEQESTVLISDLLELQGIDAYESEILYFHAIANELRLKSNFP